MSYHDLRDFIAQLEEGGELRRLQTPVSPYLEMTALCDRVLRASGPAILFACLVFTLTAPLYIWQILA